MLQLFPTLHRLLALRAALSALPGLQKFAWSLALALACSPALAQSTDDEIAVHVERRDNQVIVDASLTVPVDIDLAWQVMTDYEHMPEFLPQLHSSKVISRQGNHLRLEQDGKVFIGPIPWSYRYVRDVELTPPMRIRSVVVGGSVESGEVLAELKKQGGETRIAYRSMVVPGVWVPLGVSEAFVRNQIHEQLGRMRDEMLRRRGAR